MAKLRQKTLARPTRKQVRISRREQRQRQAILSATLFVVVLVLGLIGYGLYDQFVALPQRPVARVGQAEITYQNLDMAVRFRRVQLLNQYWQLLQLSQFGGGSQYQAQLQQLEAELSNPVLQGRAVLDTLIEEELARREAAERGIAVSEEEVERRIQRLFGYYPAGTPTPFPTPTRAPTLEPTAGPSPTVDPDVEPTVAPTEGPSATPLPTATPFTEAAYREVYADYVDGLSRDTRMSDKDLRRVFETAIINEMLSEAVITDIPTEEENVHARHILLGLEDGALAQEVLDRALAGEDFVALAAEYSTDESNANDGGELGWFPRGRMVAPFEEAVFAADVGVIPELVATEFGYHIIEVLGRENRSVPEYMVEQQRSQAYREWLSELRSNADVEIFPWWEDDPPDQPELQTFIQDQQATAQAAATATARAAPAEQASPEP